MIAFVFNVHHRKPWPLTAFEYLIIRGRESSSRSSEATGSNTIRSHDKSPPVEPEGMREATLASTIRTLGLRGNWIKHKSPAAGCQSG
jgi:hypothetical protein